LLPTAQVAFEPRGSNTSDPILLQLFQENGMIDRVERFAEIEGNPDKAVVFVQRLGNFVNEEMQCHIRAVLSSEAELIFVKNS
jgi:hypothetical protein